MNQSWDCKKTGKCCTLFVSTGPELTIQEADLIAERMSTLGLPGELISYVKKHGTIPITGAKVPKKCIFLENALCAIHDIKPELCREYPLEIRDMGKNSRIFISYDCPRAEKIENSIKNRDLPNWLEKKLKNKAVETRLVSFYDEKMRYYFND